jgi:hypothetical protein
LLAIQCEALATRVNPELPRLLCSRSRPRAARTLLQGKVALRHFASAEGVGARLAREGAVSVDAGIASPNAFAGKPRSNKATTVHRLIVPTLCVGMQPSDAPRRTFASAEHVGGSLLAIDSPAGAIYWLDWPLREQAPSHRIKPWLQVKCSGSQQKRQYLFQQRVGHFFRQVMPAG